MHDTMLDYTLKESSLGGSNMYRFAILLGKILASLLVASTLSGCANNVASQVDLKHIQTIGIASSIGDKVSYQKVGVTVFTNETTSGDTSGWGIDEIAISTIQKVIERSYSVVPVNLDHAVLNKEYGMFDAPRLSDRLRDSIKPSATPVDAYLLLTLAETGDFIGRSNQPLSGVAIYRRLGSGMQLYAVCNLYLVSAQDFRIIAEAPLVVDLGPPTTGQILTGQRFNNIQRPYHPVDKSLHTAKVWDDFTEPQIAWIKSAISKIMEDSIPLTLTRMGLAR